MRRLGTDPVPETERRVRVTLIRARSASVLIVRLRPPRDVDRRSSVSNGDSLGLGASERPLSPASSASLELDSSSSNRRRYAASACSSSTGAAAPALRPGCRPRADRARRCPGGAQRAARATAGRRGCGAGGRARHRPPATSRRRSRTNVHSPAPADIEFSSVLRPSSRAMSTACSRACAARAKSSSAARRVRASASVARLRARSGSAPTRRAVSPASRRCATASSSRASRSSNSPR